MLVLSYCSVNHIGKLLGKPSGGRSGAEWFVFRPLRIGIDDK